MLLPHMREPETGSRMPSISTGGAATKAVMKQNSCCKQRWDHQYAEPADVQTIVCAGYPVTESIPVRLGPS